MWLCLDTATELLSVAVLGPSGELCAEIQQRAPRLHSARLVPAMEEVLRLAGVAKGELGFVAANRGPGSYTGLRIALATAQAFAEGLGIAAVGVPGLPAAAAAQAVDGLVAPCLDARRGDVFCALYENRGRDLPREVMAPGLRGLRDFAAQVAELARPWLLLGDLPKALEPELLELACVRLGPRELRAADLGRFAIRAREEALMADAFSTSALYLRPPAVGGKPFDG